MGNIFNNGPKILKLIVRVRIYHILINIYRSQTDYSTILYQRNKRNLQLIKCKMKFTIEFVCVHYQWYI